ncbi:MAG: efflux RND transporter periplasmic adaptor subunit [Deltaproteobacteria bacterium]|nr:efflux RND transporter periplasmic adaptor subunit [Deltaproteobacteria bacterium]
MKVTFVILLFLTGLGAIAFLTYKNREPIPEGGLIQEVARTTHPVRTERVQPELLVERLISTGVLKAERDIVLSSEVMGRVKKVFKSLGDRCKKGETILRLDPEGYQIALAQARTAVKQGSIALDHAGRDMSRMRELEKSAVATAQQLDAAEGSESVAAAGVEQAQVSLRAAQRNLRETNVRCPFTGFVARRMVDMGQAVSLQTPLARLVDTSKLRLALSVTSAEISRIKVGQAVKLSDPALPDRIYRGSVSRVGVAADSMTRSFPIEVLVDEQEEGLRAGQVVHAGLELEEHADVLTVPMGTIVSSDGGRSVFVVVKNLAKKVQVTTGPRIDGKVIIRSGLKTGDEVITVGGTDLKDGAAVEVVGRPPVAEAEQPAEKQPIVKQPETSPIVEAR